MYIPTNLVEELKRYLKQQSNNGNLEAQTLLAQIEEIATLQSVSVEQGIEMSRSEDVGLGC